MYIPEKAIKSTIMIAQENFNDEPITVTGSQVLFRGYIENIIEQLYIILHEGRMEQLRSMILKHPRL